MGSRQIWHKCEAVDGQIWWQRSSLLSLLSLLVKDFFLELTGWQDSVWWWISISCKPDGKSMQIVVPSSAQGGAHKYHKSHNMSRVLSSFRPTDSRFICDPAWRDQKQTTNSGPSCNKKQVIQWNRSIIHVFVSIREHKKTQCQVPTVSFHPARLNPIPVIATSFSGCTFRFIVSLSCSSVGNSTFRSVVPIKTRSLMDPVLYWCSWVHWYICNPDFQH